MAFSSFPYLKKTAKNKSAQGEWFITGYLALLEFTHHFASAK
jgi:hypothetical protein